MKQLSHLLAVVAAFALPSELCAEALYVKTGLLIDVARGRALKSQCIRVEGQRIRSVGKCGKPPAKARLVDWSRYTVLPGLIDLHTHVADVGQSADVAEPIKTSLSDTLAVGAKNALATLQAGFTSVRDVGAYRGLSDVILRDAINSGRFPGPRMFVSGAYITRPGGGGEINGVGAVPADFRMGVSATPQEARERTAFLLKNGVDLIKIIATGAVLAIGTEPGVQELDEVTIRASVAEAERLGSYATAHAHGADGIIAAIRAGARSIEHASLIDDAGLKLAKARGTWLVMDIFNGDYIEEVGTKEKWPAEYLRKNRETTDVQREGFRKAVRMGVRIGYGTDSGVYPHGINARQFAYMVKYGMTPMQAIQSATIEAARLMRKERDFGVLAKGRFADMIAVEGNPIEDARRLETVAHVMKDGVVVK